MVVRLTHFNLSSEKVAGGKDMFLSQLAPEIKKQKGNSGIMLLEPSDSSGDYISQTSWETKEAAEEYESSGKYKEMVDKLRSFTNGQPSLKTYTTQ